MCGVIGGGNGIPKIQGNTCQSRAATELSTEAMGILPPPSIEGVIGGGGPIGTELSAEVPPLSLGGGAAAGACSGDPNGTARSFR